GAGETTLLQHILKSDHGLRIAVIVNDMPGVNIDAATITQTYRLNKTQEKVTALQNGFICCTLRGDLLDEIFDLWKLQNFDYIVIESSGITEPEEVAASFDSRNIEQLAGSGEGIDEITLETLQDISEWLTLNITREFHTDELVSQRQANVEPNDERTVSELMIDQIEFADVILLNKIDTVDEETKSRTTKLIKQLNHRAKILESSFGKVDLHEILNTSLFDPEVAMTGYGWLQDLKAMTVEEVEGGNVATTNSKSKGYQVQSLVYTKYRPFHPKRLFTLLYDKFILRMEYPDDEQEQDKESQNQGMDVHENEQSSEENVVLKKPDWTKDFETPPHQAILDTKRNHPILGSLYCSKGEFLLATRPNQAGEWSSAGSMLTLACGRPWFCTLDPEQYLTGDRQVDRLVQWDIEKGGELGDGRQEIVFIGEKLNHDGIRALLDVCLLTVEEYETWKGIMRDSSLDEEAKENALLDIFEDGFPDWPGFDDDEHEHDHGHDHAGHDHSGHRHPHAHHAKSATRSSNQEG
ncbi:CobW/HypB/UreG, nucleotide-binding domain-containing protein, partial [Emericellopsis atlantica]